MSARAAIKAVSGSEAEGEPRDIGGMIKAVGGAGGGAAPLPPGTK